MSDTNVIIASFTDRKAFITGAAFQYDYGQILEIHGISAVNPEVHFSTDQYAGIATTVQSVTSEGVTTVEIPDELLFVNKIKDFSIYAFVYDKNGDTSAATTNVIIIPVIARPKPDYDFPFIPEDRQTVIQKLWEAINGKGDKLSYDSGNLSLLSGNTSLSLVSLAVSDSDAFEFLDM